MHEVTFAALLGPESAAQPSPLPIRSPPASPQPFASGPVHQPPPPSQIPGAGALSPSGAGPSLLSLCSRMALPCRATASHPCCNIPCCDVQVFGRISTAHMSMANQQHGTQLMEPPVDAMLQQRYKALNLLPSPALLQKDLPLPLPAPLLPALPSSLPLPCKASQPSCPQVHASCLSHPEQLTHLTLSELVKSSVFVSPTCTDLTHMPG